MGVSVSLPYNIQNGTLEDATLVMANYNAIVTALSTSAAASGANNDITSLAGLTSPISAAGGRTQVYIQSGSTTGSANAQTLGTLIPANYSRAVGSIVVFTPGYSNSGATTLTDGIGTVNLYKQSSTGPVACVGGEVIANQQLAVVWDGTQYEILNNNPVVTGKHTIFVPAAAMQAGLTNGAVATQLELPTNKYVVNSLAYDQSTKQYAYFHVAMPKSWDAGVIQAQFYWYGTTGTGNVIWNLEAAAIADSATLDAAFSSPGAATDTYVAANFNQASPSTGNITVQGSVAALNLVEFRVSRDAANVNDTYNASSYLTGVLITYNTNAAVDN